MAEVVTREVAEEEIKNWLDSKKIFTSQREKEKDSIELLIDAMCEGVLVLDSETNIFTLNLLFPIQNEIPTTALTFKARLNDKILKPHINGIKSGDITSFMAAYIAALTGVPKELVINLDSMDKKIATAIVVFFT